jgi:tyrosyl-tRNA synthetase
MSFIKDFEDKGFLYQCTDIEKLKELMQTRKITAYIGFDCTASSLHVGSLMQIMILRLLQQHGHKPIVLIGGGTSKVGDPTGKDEARKTLTQEEIRQNAVGIKKSLSKFINFGTGASDAILLDNSEWLDSLNYLSFLRDFGSSFSVNRMLSMDSVKLRLDREQHMSFLEFNYMLLQAYDFYHLHKTYDCCLQIGGSDQWGNIVMGVDFTRKLTGGEVFGITTPLLTTASGGKMGKSVGGAVWLNEEMFSPYDYYQYWRNCEDQDVSRFAKLYCEFTPDLLDNFITLAKTDINKAKKQLAFNLTALCHGIKAAELALETSTKVFEQGSIDHNLPTIEIEHGKLQSGIPAYQLLYDTGLVPSKSEGRKLIRGAGARVNDQTIHDENALIDLSFVLADDIIKLSVGKKKHVLVKIVM